jgi:hypothetical protein
MNGDNDSFEIGEMFKPRNSRDPSISPLFIKREASANPDQKPDIPVPILPLPLPSKRFRKNSPREPSSSRWNSYQSSPFPHFRLSMISIS